MLLGCAGEEFDQFGQGDAVLEVFEQCVHRNAATTKHPGAAYPQGVALHGSTARPTEIGL